MADYGALKARVQELASMDWDIPAGAVQAQGIHDLHT